MSDTSIVAFLGDSERTFDVAPHVLELERVTGCGIGALIKRVVAADYNAADLPAIIRLALIGGGATPHEAATIVAVYVEGRPLAEGHALATAILMALWAGKPRVPAVAAKQDEDDALVVTIGNRVVRFNNDGSETVLRGEP